MELVANQSASQKKLICAESSAGFFNELGHSIVWLKLHSKQEQSSILCFATQLVLDSLEQGYIMLIGIKLIHLLQVFRRHGADQLEKTPFVCTELAFSHFIKRGNVLSNFVFRVIIGVVFFFSGLKTVENKSLEVTRELRIQFSSQVLVIAVEEFLFQNLHFLVGSTANDGIQECLVGANALACLHEHITLGFIRRNSQKLEGRTEVTISTLLSHQVLQFLSVDLFVTESDLATIFGAQKSKLFDQPQFIGSKAFASFVNALDSVVDAVVNCIRRKVALVNDGRIKIERHGSLLGLRSCLGR
mmetsp:Transcript_4054/g.6375  ORF Transcript_4054/g.6375 Transcript_4054/m.6375 type:complete len:302 (+) Transcript_4054:812-1717(+)